jgi:sigma-B regulation protein RsbU (phosphoserine phosphatase)
MNVASDSANATPDAPARLKVLLVEDNPGDVRLLKFMLAEAGDHGFELECADRLSAGLERLAKGGIGIVLMDLSLPDSQGLETFAKVRAQAPQVPIIVMSGLSNEALAVKAVHEGAQDYFVKGHVDGYLLVRAMRYALERKRMADQLASQAEELRRKNAQIEGELKVAREIQQLFLPPENLQFPATAPPDQAALRFRSLYRPAAALSGDFFNIFPVSAEAAGVFICDVVGHGASAALVTAMLRTLIEELRASAAEAGVFMAGVNRSLYSILRRTEAPILATACYLVMDVTTGELSFVRAGHPSPLRVRRHAGVVEPLTTYDARHGPALGLFDKPEYPTCRVRVSEGDLIVMFTDGLYEVEGTGHDEFGLERLHAAVRQRAGLAAGQMFAELLAEIRQFAADREFQDDVCLVGMEIARLGGPNTASNSSVASLLTQTQVPT